MSAMEPTTPFADVHAAMFETRPDFALYMDSIDPFSEYRERFFVPQTSAGESAIYLVGNSLGLQPRGVKEILDQELSDWATLAVDGHMNAHRPWLPYHECVRDGLARLVGGLPHEVVAMNTLSVNLHLLLVSFFRPEGERRAILIEDGAFPSDNYVVETHLRSRGLDPKNDLIIVKPREGESLLRTEDILDVIEKEKHRLATIMLGGVNYRTGQLLDMPAITAAGHESGALVGFDLAHAAGNVPLALHDWNVDFAAWCSYKYLNCGPGAVGGVFIHERHVRDTECIRYGGWWGNDPDTRFNMHSETAFDPVKSADAWQLSNPPIFSLAPMIASLAIFDECGMERLRAKSRVLTGYLHFMLREHLQETSEVITPSNSEERGCQISVRLYDRPRERFDALASHGIHADFRTPDIIRLAPTPLYNTFEDCHKTAEVLGSI